MILACAEMETDNSGTLTVHLLKLRGHFFNMATIQENVTPLHSTALPMKNCQNNSNIYLNQEIEKIAQTSSNFQNTRKTLQQATNIIFGKI